MIVLYVGGPSNIFSSCLPNTKAAYAQKIDNLDPDEYVIFHLDKYIPPVRKYYHKVRLMYDKLFRSIRGDKSDKEYLTNMYLPLLAYLEWLAETQGGTFEKIRDDLVWEVQNADELRDGIYSIRGKYRGINYYGVSYTIHIRDYKKEMHSMTQIRILVAYDVSKVKGSIPLFGFMVFKNRFNRSLADRDYIAMVKGRGYLDRGGGIRIVIVTSGLRKP